MEVKINKSKKNLSDEDMQNLSKEELIEQIKKLKAHNIQLKNIIEKKINPKGSHVHRIGREFNFSKWHKRRILLKFCYLGWDMQGYVVQEDTIETVEYNIFEAMKKVCLINATEDYNYHRCGRTDKGVSAFEQAISITVRSKISPDQQLTKQGVEDELNYCSLLNNVLPKNIRCICWMPLVGKTFSARFDCNLREYKYFFPKGNLNIEAMRKACTYLVGSHDFRNLCKMDVGNGVVNFTRRLDDVSIKLQAKNFDGDEGYDMYFFHIKGNAFLWHQIRCIVSILFLVGEEKEDPEVIEQLLDVTTNDQKPQYSLASEIPLNLFFTHFREDKVGEEEKKTAEMANKWFFHKDTLKEVIEDLQAQWCEENIKSVMIYEMTKFLQNTFNENFPDEAEPIRSQANSLNKDTMRRQYKKLLDRQKCSALDDRIQHYVKKKRITIDITKNWTENSEVSEMDEGESL